MINKNALLISLFFLLSSALTAQSDLGGSASAGMTAIFVGDEEKISTDPAGLYPYMAISPWFYIGLSPFVQLTFNGAVSQSGSFDYLDNWKYTASEDMLTLDQETGLSFSLPTFLLAGDFGRIDFKLMRFPARDHGSLVIDTPLDGLSLGVNVGFLDFRGIVGYTGLLFQEDSGIELSSNISAIDTAASEQGSLFAPGRLIWMIKTAYKDIAIPSVESIGLSFVALHELTPQSYADGLSVEYNQPNIFYGSLDLEGQLLPGFLYSIAGAGNYGTTGKEAGENVIKSFMGAAGTASLDIYSDSGFHLGVGTGVSMRGRKAIDKDDSEKGVTATGYFGITPVSIGSLSGRELSDGIIYLDGTISFNILETLYIEGITTFITNMDVVMTENDWTKFPIGNETAVNVQFNFFYDFFVNANGAVFIPMNSDETLIGVIGVTFGYTF